MKSNELRIGNLVKDRGDKILRIDWFEINKVCQRQMLGNFEVHPLTEYFEYLKPIELSEKWLLRFGFEKDGCSYYAPNFDGFRLRIYRENDSFFFGINICRSIEIEFIHELQNLVFILTGEELQILP